MKNNVEKIRKNRMIDQMLYESMIKYVHESAEILIEQICNNCPLDNEQCRIMPCNPMATLITEHAYRHIAYIAMMN